jgi:predicted acetyltransferase
VSTSLDIIRDGIVEVYCISTIPDYRGKGIGRFVTAEPLRIASEEGYKTAILQASLQGAPVYRHLGFDSFGVIPLYVRTPAK